MKNLYIISILILALSLNAQALFEVKDASDHSVFEITNDGIRIFNYPDTLMIISSAEIRANLDNSKGLSRSFSVSTNATGKGGGDVVNIDADGLRVYNGEDKLMDITGDNITAYIDSNSTKGLSRSFSVSTNATGKAGYDILDVTTETTKMREGTHGNQYTDFSENNIFLGLNAGIATVPEITTWDSGQGNVFMGNGSGLSNISGKYNVYIGKDAGTSVTDKSYNTYVGNSAGKIATGYFNTYVGNQSGWSGSGNYNSFFGNSPGWFSSGSYNCLFGVSAGRNIGGNWNVIMGNDAGRGDIGSAYNNNCLIGYRSGYVLDTGSSNVMMGYQSGYSNEVGLGNVFLGNQSGYNETGSNKLYIDNSNTTTPLIHGDFGTDELTLNGYVGIGSAPSSTYKLYVHNNSYSGISSYAYTSSQAYVNGVYGRADDGTTRNVGIFGYSTGGTGVNWAGWFQGDINVTGTVSKSVSKTVIDHPLDPKNKFLTHSSVESDKMMNIYNGVIFLNNDGIAIVNMPDWFESLNTEFRYQLTAIGAPGPNLYISKKISGNTFEMSGGEPNMEVSWQVTGVRQDNYAKSNPIEVEKSKDSIEKGYYLHPEAYGLSEEDGIEYQHTKRMDEQTEK